MGSKLTVEKLDKMMAGLESVTQGPRHMHISPNDILVTDDAGNNIAHFLPMEDDANADFLNAQHFCSCNPDTMRELIALARAALTGDTK